MQWTYELQQALESEEKRILQQYHDYMRLSDRDKETLHTQWSEYFKEVFTESPYVKIYKRTRAYTQCSGVALIEAITQVSEDLGELRNTYTNIRKPSSEDPQFLIVKYGQIMHMRNLKNFFEEKKQGKKEGVLVKNVRSAFGI